MLSKYLQIPFAIGALVFLYLAWEVRSGYAIYIVPFVVAMAIIYTLSPQVDWWWYQRKPPELPTPLRHLINTAFPFYQKLSADEKTRFRQRMALYMHANEFMPQGMDNVPVDVKGVVAASVVQLTFGLDDYLLNKFEHIVIYPHPFPSPQFPEKWHTSEIYEEDGVILFSAEQLMASFLQPVRFFNSGLYEYARVFRRCYPAVVFPSFGENDWEALQQVSGFSKNVVEKWIGLPDPDAVAVAVVYFFVFPEKFRAVLPEAYQTLAGIFRQGP
jgi:hypothetical protein